MVTPLVSLHRFLGFSARSLDVLHTSGVAVAFGNLRNLRPWKTPNLIFVCALDRAAYVPLGFWYTSVQS